MIVVSGTTYLLYMYHYCWGNWPMFLFMRCQGDCCDHRNIVTWGGMKTWQFEDNAYHILIQKICFWPILEGGIVPGIFPKVLIFHISTTNYDNEAIVRVRTPTGSYRAPASLYSRVTCLHNITIFWNAMWLKMPKLGPVTPWWYGQMVHTVVEMCTFEACTTSKCVWRSIPFLRSGHIYGSNRSNKHYKM